MNVKFKGAINPFTVNSILIVNNITIMKKMIFAVGAMLFAFSTVNAQQAATQLKAKSEVRQTKVQHDKASVSDRVKRRTEKLTSICSLTDEQRAAIIQINTEFFTKQDQIVKSAENKEALKSLRKERHQKEVKVLTPEQIEKLKAYQAQQKQNQSKAPKGAMPENATQED